MREYSVFSLLQAKDASTYQRVEDAYLTLSNHDRRALYDKSLRSPAVKQDQQLEAQEIKREHFIIPEETPKTRR